MNTAYFYLTDEGGKLALHHGNRNRCAYSRSANRTQDE